MKLDDAYNAWGGQSENRELAQKTKTLFRKMWWLIPTNKPCSYYTLDVLGRALAQTNGAHSDKVNAASVMCHVLNYAHNVDPEANPKPEFIYNDIVNYTGEKDASEQAREDDDSEQAREQHDRGQVPGRKQTGENAAARDLSPVMPTNEDAPQVKVKPAAKAKRMAELAKRDNGKAAKAVVQLDAETLKPVKVWPSCFSAQKELGIKNVQRAIVRHGISGGFYWCRPGDEEGFKPADMRTHNGNKKKIEKPKITFKPTEEEKELVKRVFGHDRGQVPGSLQTREKEMTGDRSLAEQTREDALPGTRPQSSQPATLQEAHENFQQAMAEHVDSILRSCTEDELIAELRRREWHGTLHITRTIEL